MDGYDERAEAIIALVRAHSLEDAVLAGQAVAGFSVREHVIKAEQRVRDAFKEAPNE